MSRGTLTARPPSGLLKGLLRLPITFYKLGLGGLLGKRFVLLHHTGRVSGKRYETVVEVVGYQPEDTTIFIVSGWGEQSNWYQNLQQHPVTDIQLGSRQWTVRADRLSPEAGADVLIRYRTQHPFAARELSHVIGIDFNGASRPELEQMVAQSLPVIALRSLAEHAHQSST